MTDENRDPVTGKVLPGPALPTKKKASAPDTPPVETTKEDTSLETAQQRYRRKKRKVVETEENEQ